MASNDTRYDNLVELVKKLFQSHKQLEEKHEKLKKEVNTLRLQMASSSCTNCSRRNPTDHANASPSMYIHLVYNMIVLLYMFSWKLWPLNMNFCHHSKTAIHQQIDS